MIPINTRERDLLRYAVSPNPDLSRNRLAKILGVVPESASRVLSKLRARGLIEIEHGNNRRILSITPTFPLEPGHYTLRNTR